MAETIEVYVQQIINVLDEYYQRLCSSETLIEATQLLEDMPSLVDHTCKCLWHTLSERLNNDYSLQMQVAKALRNRLYTHFSDNKIVLVSEYTIIQYFHHAEKYDRQGDIDENHTLLDIFNRYLTDEEYERFLRIEFAFQQEGYKIP